MIGEGWGRPLLPEILDQTDCVERNRRFSIYFRNEMPVSQLATLHYSSK